MHSIRMLVIRAVTITRYRRNLTEQSLALRIVTPSSTSAHFQRGATRPRALFIIHIVLRLFPNFTLHLLAADTSCIAVMCLFIDHLFSFTARMWAPLGQGSFVCFVHHCISYSLKNATQSGLLLNIWGMGIHLHCIMGKHQHNSKGFRFWI